MQKKKFSGVRGDTLIWRPIILDDFWHFEIFHIRYSTELRSLQIQGLQIVEGDAVEQNTTFY